MGGRVWSLLYFSWICGFLTETVKMEISSLSSGALAVSFSFVLARLALLVRSLRTDHTSTANQLT